jgi:hypothetical protein
MEYLKRIYDRYHKASKSEKSGLLDELCRLVHCHRKHAIRLLAQLPPSRKNIRVPQSRGRVFRYRPSTIALLSHIWQATGFLCSQRLKPAIPLWLPWAKKQFPVDPAVERELLAISPRQMDRRLAAQKQRLKKKLYGTTKPGSLLKSMIPIKTDFWDVKVPGFQEIDLVSHSGPNTDGDFLHTLTVTDIKTTWTEQQAVLGKSQAAVVDGMGRVESRLPFPLRGVDSDNGSEFINHHLWAFCRQRPPHKKVQFTRSRPYKKDDNAHVEQKNWTHVRKLIGYQRFDSLRALAAVNALYADFRILINLFLPSMKLLEKVRKGSKLIRRYDASRTPLQRVLECPQADPIKIKELLRILQATDPFALAQSVERRREELHQLAAKPGDLPRKSPSPESPSRNFSFSTKLKRRETIHRKCNVRWLEKISRKELAAR